MMHVWNPAREATGALSGENISTDEYANSFSGWGGYVSCAGSRARCASYRGETLGCSVRFGRDASAAGAGRGMYGHLWVDFTPTSARS